MNGVIKRLQQNRKNVVWSCWQNASSQLRISTQAVDGNNMYKANRFQCPWDWFNINDSVIDWRDNRASSCGKCRCRKFRFVFCLYYTDFSQVYTLLGRMLLLFEVYAVTDYDYMSRPRQRLIDRLAGCCSGVMLLYIAFSLWADDLSSSARTPRMVWRASGSRAWSRC